MFNYLKNLFFPEKVQFLGVIDTGSNVNVIDFREVVATSAAPLWVEKKQTQWRTFFQQFQSTSSACVAFTIAKLASILFEQKTQQKVKFSPGWIYNKRSNFPGEGMIADNAVAIASSGIPTNEIYPSEGLSESKMNELPHPSYIDDVAEVFAISSKWVNMNQLDFDTVASTIQKTGKGIMLWFQFGKDEFFKRQIPIVKNVSLQYKHSTTALDSFLVDGKEYILIEDSSESGIWQRLISRNFFNNRCILARYPLNFKFDEVQNQKPKYTETTLSLQECLQYGGEFPSNIVPTGFYGVTTTESVKKFQLKSGLEPVGTVGPKTTSKLLELYP